MKSRRQASPQEMQIYMLQKKLALTEEALKTVMISGGTLANDVRVEALWDENTRVISPKRLEGHLEHWRKSTDAAQEALKFGTKEVP